MTSPQISVLMTAYNVDPYVGDAIDSILTQSFGDFELLVIDDQSTDGTAAIIAERAAKDSRIRVLPSLEKGRVPALNALLAEARAPWIAVMDSDDIALPDRFEKQMAFLTANPDCGVLGGMAQNMAEDGTLLPRPESTIALTHDAIIADRENGIPLRNPTVIARTELLRDVGGYRRPFRFAQDYDLYLRLHTRTRLANLPDILLYYRIHPTQVSTRNAMAQTQSAVVAWLSCKARLEGKPDPVDALDALPAIGTLDTLFDMDGADALARRRIVDRIRYSPDMLGGEGFPVLAGYARDTGASKDLWRMALRLLRAGHALAPLKLAMILARA